MKKRRQLIDSDTWVLLKQMGIGLLVISTVALFITGIWYGTRVDALTITTIKVEGGETIDHSEIKKLVQSTLDGNYVGLVPKKFAWFFPKNEMISAVEKIERLHNVDVKRENGREVRVTFDEYVPKALWCASADDMECVFVDNTGFAFSSSPNLSGGSFLRFVTTGRETAIDTNLTDEESFLELIRLTKLLAEHEWYVSSVELDQVGDVFLKIVEGGELKVVASEAPENTVKNLLTVLASEEFTHLQPGNFQYIDLRFGNKVYVNEEAIVLEEELEIGDESATSTPE